ncbi:VIT family protein, partial [Rhodoblastus sp.]|uniref:VIT family protein n=1 Tax=Rhodoblastus sp. TaxID=1962975 RepID=UPI0035ADBB46
MRQVKPSLFDPLEPEEILAEVVAGLIMVLTFTLIASLLSQGSDHSPRTFVIAAAGCNVAWGVIDAALYLLGCKTVRSYRRLFLRKVQRAPDQNAAQEIVRREWEPILAQAAPEEDRERLYSAMRQLAVNARPISAKLRPDDFKGALAIFALVCATVVPAILPFLFLPNDWLTLRLSN